MVFLCHLNTPKCAWNLLPSLVTDLEKLGLSLNDFKLYTSSGVNPWPMIVVGAITVASYVPKVLGPFGISITGLTVFLVMGVGSAAYFHLKRIGLWVALWRAKGLRAERKFLGYAFTIPGVVRSHVCVTANPLVEVAPKVRRYCTNGVDRLGGRYSAPSVKTEMKAKGSA